MSEWDVEVLDRPLPPISDELLKQAAKEYAAIRGLVYVDQLHDGLAAVINLVRKYDAEHDNKENA